MTAPSIPGSIGAAHAYAKQACYQDENIPIAENAFLAGTRWARDRIAAQEPTEDDAYAAYIEWDRHVAYGERGALRCHCGAPGVWGSTAAHEQHSLWHALRAARRDEVTP